MEDLEILINVLLSNCRNKQELQEGYIVLKEKLEELTKNREKELEEVV